MGGKKWTGATSARKTTKQTVAVGSSRLSQVEYRREKEANTFCQSVQHQCLYLSSNGFKLEMGYLEGAARDVPLLDPQWARSGRLSLAARHPRRRAHGGPRGPQLEIPSNWTPVMVPNSYRSFVRT